MNVFLCDTDARAAARALADPHVVKMASETAQILSTVLRGRAAQAGVELAPDTAHSIQVRTRTLAPDTLWKSTHPHHPVTRYAAESGGYAYWVYCHGVALCDEYAARYGRRHKAADVLEACAPHVPSVSRLEVALAIAKAPLAMPDEYRQGDVVSSYRAYLAAKYTSWDSTWRRACWTNAEPPPWLADVPTRTKEK